MNYELFTNFAPKINEMKRIIFFAISLLLFTACHKNDDPAPDPTPDPSETEAQRTVLIYMSGENSLSYDPSESGSFLADDLQEIIEGSYDLNSNQHLICFIDSVGILNYPHIIEVAGGKAKEIYRYDSEFYASDPAKFREVLQYTFDKYPAKEYGLVLWGHGNGWIINNDTIPSKSYARAATRAYGQDKGWDNSGSDRWMNITQMAKALEGLPKLKYIFADCCNMQSVEVGYELRNAAEYFIGSPAEIPGEGAPYHKILPKLFSNSSTFYKDICDCYYDYIHDAYMSTTYTVNSGFSYIYGFSLPLSVFDLSKMDALANATKELMQTFMPKYPNELNLNGHPFYFALAGDMIMYDMKSVISQNAPEADYKKWLEVFNSAVPYQLISKRWMTEHNAIYNSFDRFPQNDDQWGCVNMFFPQSRYNSAYYHYNDLIRYTQWYYAVNWPDYGW